MYLAKVRVTLKPTVNDPQGITVLGGLKSLGFDTVEGVRVGKYLEIQVAEPEPSLAQEKVTQMCQQLLANPVIEEFSVELEEIVQSSDS